jgi:hypothetical protein
MPRNFTGNDRVSDRVESAMRCSWDIRSISAGSVLATGLVLLAGCTAGPGSTPRHELAGTFQLVAFDSCANALNDLKAATKAYVGPWGFGGGGVSGADAVARGAPVPAPAAQAPGAPGLSNGRSAEKSVPDHSRTNTHVAGVDEPDLVKTDGRRIVTVNRGKLRVVDAATRLLAGELDLTPGAGQYASGESNLLLSGNRALVLVREQGRGVAMPIAPEADRPSSTPPDSAIAGLHLMMVDLSGRPRIVSDYRIDGNLVDARQVGAVVRVVVRSAPRLIFPYRDRATDAQRAAANREIIDQATADAWLPRYETSSGGSTSTGRIGCDRLSRPPTYSGTSMISVLSFDLGGSTLGDGDPVTVVADGDTVFSNGPHLYLANDQRWRVMPGLLRRNAGPDPRDEVTEIYQFDTSKPGRPRYVAAATVPGWLVNQYAMSEWDGHLRVATTSGRTWGENPSSSSAVYVLRADGKALAQTGRVTGLGRGERIYGVRFVDGTGYVVTFRQTDPLYTVDLRDPRAPKVTGELKITGYSAYLHPMGDGRLLGVGQDASTQGRRQGVQVSLFDVSDPSRPTRLAQHQVAQGQSEAEFDPHAFLYWPATHLVVVPLTVYGRAVAAGQSGATAGAMALRVTDGGFIEVALLDHAESHDVAAAGMIRRSLVVDGVLWTLSDAGLKATELSTMKTIRWLSL